jgi:putative ABC transport system substrate-binding protein
MNNRRQLIIAIGVSSLASPLVSFAQQPARIARIGFLGVRSRSTPSNPDAFYEAFLQGMRELGYVEGKNLVIEWRFADGDYNRLAGLATELVQLNVEVIVTHATAGTRAAQQATGRIPIVTAAVVDMIGSGFSQSLAHPEGNITGFSQIVVDVSPKHIELMKTMIPKLRRIAILVNPGNSSHSSILKSTQAAATQLGATMLPISARSPEEIERGFVETTRARADAILIAADGFFIGQRQQIVALTTKHRLPSMFAYREDVVAGGLMSYGQNVAEFYRRAATYVDRILHGAKPGDLPIEQPTRINLAINRKTARALGLTIPQEMLLRADEMIE